MGWVDSEVSAGEEVNPGRRRVDVADSSEEMSGTVDMFASQYGQIPLGGWILRGGIGQPEKCREGNKGHVCADTVRGEIVVWDREVWVVVDELAQRNHLDAVTVHKFLGR